jgi:indoleamine 2,3-dioxygenase
VTTRESSVVCLSIYFADIRSFVASSYLLEPCWKVYSNNADDGYGLGREVLPKCIAGPLVKCAEM